MSQGRLRYVFGAACLNALPTRSNLCQRRILSEDACVVCGGTS